MCFHRKENSNILPYAVYLLSVDPHLSQRAHKRSPRPRECCRPRTRTSLHRHWTPQGWSACARCLYWLSGKDGCHGWSPCCHGASLSQWAQSLAKSLIYPWQMWWSRSCVNSLIAQLQFWYLLWQFILLHWAGSLNVKFKHRVCILSCTCNILCTHCFDVITCMFL